MFSLFSTNNLTAQSYTALWKNYETYADNGKPQSAYKVARQILQKALAEGNMGQALSARLSEASLHQSWAPDSFFTDVAELEQLREVEQKAPARAIYSSILAEVYQSNRFRSQASGLELTSDDMHEWTVEQYDSAARRNWELSLQPLAELFDARSDDWLPFVEQERSSSYFHHDVLHILWQRYCSSASNDSLLYAHAAEIVALYRSKGNIDAALLVELDLAGMEKDKLLKLVADYGNQPLCAEVYLRLLDTDAPDSQRLAWAQEALRRYPRYERIGEIKNKLNYIIEPGVKWEGHNVYYPHKHYQWLLRGKNATSATIEVLRLPDDFHQSQLDDQKDCEKYLRRIGKVVDTINHRFEHGNSGNALAITAESIAEYTDTIDWQAPDLGRYVLLFSVETAEPQSEERRKSGWYRFIDVASMQMMLQGIGDTLHIVVVDAESGHPVPNAVITAYRYRESESTRKPVAIVQTDAEGRAQLPLNDDHRSYTMIVATAKDTFSPEENYTSGRHWSSTRSDGHPLRCKLYTDRAIYRPGQTVHVGGIAFHQNHWLGWTWEGKRYDLIMYDANGKKVASKTVKTDDMGVLSADFVLPAGLLPGRFSISTSGTSVSFRVEEYKRPTFEVKIDETPALQWPQDSITFTGRAMGYNGVPVRNGNVVVSWRLNGKPWTSGTLPSVQTDEQGCFNVKVPLPTDAGESVRYGIYLNVNVDVTNVAGETQHAQRRTMICSTPLRITIDMPTLNDRDRMAAPALQLLSSTGKPVAGDIRWQVVPAAKATDGDDSSAAVANGKLVLPQPDMEGMLAALRGLSSGEYELQTFGQAGNDTASARQRFVVFSMDDTQPATRHDLWLYCPNDTFAIGHNAVLQVGTSYDDVAMYWTLEANEKIYRRGMTQFSNEVRKVEIPYKPYFGDGATLHIAFVKGGNVYTKSQTLRLAMPDKKLRWQWTSFRDRVHPGDTETWTLSITRPDGTPASANLMATIYDATLDGITPHVWQQLMLRRYNIKLSPWEIYQHFNHSVSDNFMFTTRYHKVPDLAFDGFNPHYFDGLYFRGRLSYGGNVRVCGLPPVMKMSSRAMGNNVGSSLHEAVPMLAAAPQAMAVANDEAVMEEARDVRNSNVNAAETVGAASPAVRTNFNETAYFAPRLRTDAKGNVTLQFTLPQSLTTWRMMGLAHTGDMQETMIEAQTVASKEMMAHLYMPRFLRAGDTGSINASIQNLTDKTLSGKVRLEVFDPESERLLSKQQTSFEVGADGETVLTFNYTPDDELTVIGVRLTADTKSFSDGEQYLLPILPNKTYVTESVEIRADSMGTFTTDLTSLFNHDAATATNRTLTIEYTTHPIWTVVQSLPALCEPQNDDVLSLTSNFYANVLASHIVATTPRLREVLELWQAQRTHGTDGLNSKLEQDEELKLLLLNETPWLQDAMSDTERMSQLCNLFDTNLLEQRLGSTLQQLTERQGSDGGFSWFPGMRSSELMTRLVCIWFTQLRSLTNDFGTLPSTKQQQANQLLRRAFGFVAAENARMVKAMKKAEAKGETIRTGHLMHLHYIYIAQRSGVSLTESQQADVRYLLDHLQGTVTTMDNQERALAAMVLKGAGRKEWRTYYESMQEHLTVTSDHGSFFDYAGGSFMPTGHKLVAHTAAMEAVQDVDVTNKTLLSGLRRWLLQQKRTQMWESSICTVNAIYALLHNNEAQLSATTADEVTLRYGRRNVAVKSAQPSAAALGYVKATYTDGKMPTAVTVHRKTNSEAWGAAYASYLTPYVDASSSSTGLSVRREFSSTQPRQGERHTTRYVITADRDYEYVCLRADRAACAEPATSRSGYRYQGGLGYYMAVHDAHTDYFFDHLPKGTYVIEETSFIDRAGSYTTGLARIQCLYAPEYGGHTAGAIISSNP